MFSYLPHEGLLIKQLDFSRIVALKCGKLLLKNQLNFKVVNQKDAQDIATTADIASEKYVISEIEKNFPDHSILSEEEGFVDKKSDFKWIIDPLDGTKEYVRGIPMWNFSMCLMYKEDPIVSVVYRPAEGSLYSAAAGIGSFLNDTKIHVSEVKKIEDSFVYCYIPSYKRDVERYDSAWNSLNKIGKKVYRLRSLSDENTALCWLAQGAIEAYLNLSNPPKPHDIYPGLLIAKEAGAVGTDIDFKSDNFQLVVANNKHIYNDLISLISE